MTGPPSRSPPPEAPGLLHDLEVERDEGLLLRQRHVVRHRLDALVAEHHLQARFAPVAGKLDGDAVFPVGKASEVHVGDAKGNHVLVAFVGRHVAGDWDGQFPDARAGTTSMPPAPTWTLKPVAGSPSG